VIFGNFWLLKSELRRNGWMRTGTAIGSRASREH